MHPGVQYRKYSSASSSNSEFCSPPIRTIDSLSSIDSTFSIHSLDAFDSTFLINSLGAINSTFSFGSLFSIDSFFTINSLGAIDSLFTIDSLGAINSISKLDSTFSVDSFFTIDSLGAIDSIASFDSTFSIDSVLSFICVRTIGFVSHANISRYGIKSASTSTSPNMICDPNVGCMTMRLNPIWPIPALTAHSRSNIGAVSIHIRHAPSCIESDKKSQRRAKRSRSTL